MLNPLLLWFLPLILVPILLHLITLRRLRTVELSTFRFLMDSYLQQRRKVKLLEFLIMLLRTAFVALVVLALARPVVNRLGWLAPGESGRHVAIIVDAGLPMGLRSGTTTSLERAKEAAKRVVGLLGASDYVTLIRAEEQPEVLISRFAAKPEPILEQIDGIRQGSATTHMAEALATALSTRERGPATIYILSDGNRAAWSTLQTHPIAGRIPEDVQVVVMNLGPLEPVTNLAVVGEAPRATSPTMGLPVLLRAVVANGSATEPVNTTLSVVLDDEQVERFNLALQPGQRFVQPVTVTPTRPGMIKGRFELAGDGFPEDDTFLFALNVAPRLSVLIVSPAVPPESPGSPEPAGGARDAGLYVHTALTAPLTARSEATLEQRQIAESLQINRATPEQVTAEMLEQADVVIVADAPLAPPQAELLRHYVAQGGGLMVLPGSQTDPAVLNQHLLGVDPAQAQEPPRVGERLTYDEPRGDPDNEMSFRPITAINLRHDILEAFADPPRGREYFGTARLYRYFPLRLERGAQRPQEAQRAQPPDVLMRLPGGAPVLVEAAHGRGRMLLASFAATPGWSNLPLKPEFVPLMLRAVTHLRRPVPAQAPSALEPRQTAALEITDRWPDAQIDVVAPDGRPSQVTLHREADRFTGGYMQTQDKGFYTVTVTPRQEGAPDRLQLGFAVNLNVEHADLTVLDDQALAGLLPGANVEVLRSTADDPVLAGRLTQEREIWRTLIVITFIIIAVEFLLATVRTVRRPRPAAATGGLPDATPAPAAAPPRGGPLLSRKRELVETP